MHFPEISFFQCYNLLLELYEGLTESSFSVIRIIVTMNVIVHTRNYAKRDLFCTG